MNQIQRKILCLGAQAEHWSDYFPDGLYVIDVADSVDCVLKKLNELCYESVIIDDGLFTDDTYIVILQIKQLSSFTPLLVLTNNESLVYQKNLLQVGADEILQRGYGRDFILQRLNLCIKRCEMAQETTQRNHRLYEVAQLTRSLHANLETTTLLTDAAERICDIFALYGIAIIIHSNGILRVYSASADQIHQRRLVQSLRDANTDDLFARVIKTSITEVFDDITEDNHYVPLPHLAQARSQRAKQWYERIAWTESQFKDNLRVLIDFANSIMKVASIHESCKNLFHLLGFIAAKRRLQSGTASSHYQQRNPAQSLAELFDRANCA